MKKDIPTTQDNLLEEQAADLGELIMERDREESIHGMHSQRVAQLERMIALQKKLVLRMVNGDEEEFLPPRPKKPHLRIVK
jgi:hypothetical protein